MLLPGVASAQPKQCRSYSNALNTCQAELRQYEPVVMPAMTASVALGETLTLTLVVPPGDRYEFASAAGDWDFQDISGGYLVTFTPEALGTFRAVYRVLRQGQLEEYPVVVTVGSVVGGSAGSTAPAPTTTTWTFCAMEYQACAFSGTKAVRYGIDGAYVERILSDGTACVNEVFGDPAVGATKHCDYR